MSEHYDTQQQCPECGLFHDTDDEWCDGLTASTYSAAIAKARREKLRECLGTIQAWASKRAMCEHNTETTLTMLARKVQETIDSVDKAGWRAAKEFEQNQTGHKPPTEDE